jgi:hypothetical protein
LKERTPRVSSRRSWGFGCAEGFESSTLGYEDSRIASCSRENLKGRRFIGSLCSNPPLRPRARRPRHDRHLESGMSSCRRELNSCFLGCLLECPRARTETGIAFRVPDAAGSLLIPNGFLRANLRSKSSSRVLRDSLASRRARRDAPGTRYSASARSGNQDASRRLVTGAFWSAECGRSLRGPSPRSRLRSCNLSAETAVLASEVGQPVSLIRSGPQTQCRLE